MKKQFARVLSFVMALMMVVTTFGTMGIFAETCSHEDKTVYVHEPQCNALGFTTNVCNNPNCNYTWTTDVKAKVPCKGELVEAEEATCTTPAYSEGERCIWCREIISGCEEIAPALGHNMDYATIDASCTEINRIEYVCLRCGYNEGAIDLEEILGFEIPDAPGHNFVYEIAEDKDGNKLAPYCTARKMKSSELKSGKPKEEYIGRAFHPINDDGTVSNEWWIVEGHNGKAVYKCTNVACSYECKRIYLEIVVLWNDSLHNFTNATQTAGKDDCFGAYYEWEECKECGFNKYNTPEYDERKPLDFDVKSFIKTDVVKHQKHLAADSEALEWAKNNAEELQKKGLKVEDIKGAEEFATCYKKGYKIEHCDICNTFFLTVSTQSHNFTSANCRREEVAATCLTPGGTRVYCVHECGATELQDKEDAWGHNYAFTCEDGCEPGKCYDCTHKNRTGVCTNEYDKPDDDTEEEVACGAEYKMPENHKHVFGDQLYYYWYENQEAVGIEESRKYTGQVSCSVDYYLYKKCECAGAPYNCNVIESAGLVPANPEKGEHTWEIVKMTIKVADCDTVGSFAVACAFCNKADTRSPDYNNNGKADDGIYIGEDACEYINKLLAEALKGVAKKDIEKKTKEFVAAFEAEYEIDFFNGYLDGEGNEVYAKGNNADKGVFHIHNKVDGSTAYDCFIAHGHNFEGVRASCITEGEILTCSHCYAKQGHDMVGKLDPTYHTCEQEVFNVPPTCGQRELVITIYGCGAPSSVKEQDVLEDELKVLGNHKSYPRYEDGRIWNELKDEDTGKITVEYNEPVPATLEKVAYKAPKCLEIGNPAYYYCPECKNYLIEDANEKIVEVINRFTKDDEGNLVENVDHAKLTANDKNEAVPYLEPTYHVGTVVEVDAVNETCTDIGWKAYAFCTACTEDAGVKVLEYPRKAFGYKCYKENIDDVNCEPYGKILDEDGEEEELDILTYHYTSETGDKYKFSTTGIVFVRKTGDIWTISDTANKLYRPIPAHTDKYQVTNNEAIDPTCSTAGLTTGTHCKLCCGKYLNPAKIWNKATDVNSPFYIAPLGHGMKPTYEDGEFVNNKYDQWLMTTVEGVCENDADYLCCAKYTYDAIWCKWCYDMEKLVDDDVEWRFTNEGYVVPKDKEGELVWYIDNVSTLYEHVWAMVENEEGKWVLDIQQTDNIPCTEETLKYKYCTNCACIEIVEVIAPQGHYYMNGDERVALDTSCKNNVDEESDTYVLGISCDGCGKNLSEDDITHNWAHVEIPETCTEDGVEFWHCTWCYIYAIEEDGKLVLTERTEAEQPIDNFDGHKFCSIVDGTYKAPTTREEGEVTYRCGRCGEEITVHIPMLDGGLNMWFTYEETEENGDNMMKSYANGDTVYVTVNVASMFEEGFEFSAMEFYLNYNTTLLEFVGAEINHDDTIATEVAAVPFGNLAEDLMGTISTMRVGPSNIDCIDVAYALGNGKIKVISYATGDSAEIGYDDEAYITLEFKVKGALALNNDAYVEFAGEYDWEADEYFNDYVVYDKDGIYMDNIAYNAWDYVSFYIELTGDVDRNGKIDIGDMVALNKLAKPGAEYDTVADINKDGIVNVKDVMKLRQFLATERTYVDYCDMMGVDFWAEFAATAEEYLPFFNAVIDVLDQVALAEMIEEYEWYFDLYFSDMSVGALASVIDSIEGDITVDEVVTIAKILMGLVEFAIPSLPELPVDVYGIFYAIPADAVSLVFGLASVLVAGDLLVGLI